jgi:hypothetical protein
MKFLYNVMHLLDIRWVDLVLTTTGKPRPDFSNLLNNYEKNSYQAAVDAGYCFDKPLWTIYEKDDLDITVNTPWCSGKVSWWITKMMPGQYMPIHSDPFTQESNVKRYWVPLMNYVPGHVFIYKDKMITNYKAGDLYEFDISTELHAAANISYVPRVMLQITEYL